MLERGTRFGIFYREGRVSPPAPEMSVRGSSDPREPGAPSHVRRRCSGTGPRRVHGDEVQLPPLSLQAQLSEREAGLMVQLAVVLSSLLTF